MELKVLYDGIEKTFEGDNIFDLVAEAKQDKLYKESSEVIFGYEEVNEYGDFS